MNNPAIFIISGPGGVGKTTLVNRLFRLKPIKAKFIKSVSATTRSPRPGEKHGVDYLFFKKEKFEGLLKKNGFLESEKVLTDYYGTPKEFYRKAALEKKSLVLCIDVKGAMSLKKKLKKIRIVTIFISAPTQKDLLNRLRHRAEDPKKIVKRIALAKKELQFSKYYDYLVINKSIPEAVALLKKILLEQSSVA